MSDPFAGTVLRMLAEHGCGVDDLRGHVMWSKPEIAPVDVRRFCGALLRVVEAAEVELCKPDHNADCGTKYRGCAPECTFEHDDAPAMSKTDGDALPDGWTVARAHELKCWPDPYAAILSGAKRFEWRKDDRDYRVGDELVEREWVPETEQYTGRYTRVRVTYILRFPSFGVPDGYCVMSIDKPEPRIAQLEARVRELEGELRQEQRTSRIALESAGKWKVRADVAEAERDQLRAELTATRKLNARDVKRLQAELTALRSTTGSALVGEAAVIKSVREALCSAGHCGDGDLRAMVERALREARDRGRREADAKQFEAIEGVCALIERYRVNEPDDVGTLAERVERVIDALRDQLEYARVQRDEARDERDEAVSVHWVLNQLAGMKFPEQGSAHDYMERCIYDLAHGPLGETGGGNG